MNNSYLMIDLLSAVYWFDEALQAGLRAKGHQPASRSQSMILANIAAGVQRPSELAKNLGVSRQAMSLALGEMAARGLVEIEPDPNDGRAQRVVFSPRSVAIRRDAIAVMIALEDELSKRIGKTRLNALRAAFGADWGLPPLDVAEVQASVKKQAGPKPGRAGKSRQ